MKKGKAKTRKQRLPLGPAGVQEVVIGKERAMLVPIDTWQRMLDELEELYDLICYEQACELPDEAELEHDELCRLLGRCPLCYLRQKAGLTQSALAKKAGLSQSYLAKVEAGERKLSKTAAGKIAQALGVAPEKLMP